MYQVTGVMKTRTNERRRDMTSAFDDVSMEVTCHVIDTVLNVLRMLACKVIIGCSICTSIPVTCKILPSPAFGPSCNTHYCFFQQMSKTRLVYHSVITQVKQNQVAALHHQAPPHKSWHRCHLLTAEGQLCHQAMPAINRAGQCLNSDDASVIVWVVCHYHDHEVLLSMFMAFTCTTHLNRECLSHRGS